MANFIGDEETARSFTAEGKAGVKERWGEVVDGEGRVRGRRGWVKGRVVREVGVGDHVLVVGEVVGVEGGEDGGWGLVYWEGGYWRVGGGDGVLGRR